MGTPSVHQNRRAAQPPAHADLICPQCRGTCTFSSEQQFVACRCGWHHTLTDEQHTDLLDAIMGITDLNVPAYLTILAAGKQSPPPAAGWLARLDFRRA